MTKLSVNLNKIALLRNSRGHQSPNLVEFAKKILPTEIGGLTLHPRPDERHANIQDTIDLKQLLSSKYAHSGKELNIEGNPFAESLSEKQLDHELELEFKNNYPGFMNLVLEVCPQQVTLVPDANDQLTSDHGWELEKDARKLEPVIKKLKNKDLRVSLFMDVEASSWQQAKDLGADRIELYTEPYARAYEQFQEKRITETQFYDVLKKYADQALSINESGLELNAGHDLNQANLPALIKAAPSIKEVSIGHALVVESLHEGILATVQNYLTILSRSCL